jgi:hypothetical protein
MPVPLFSTDFMSAWAWRAPNGDLYTAVKTAPAVVVLLYSKKGNDYRVVLIEQVRPENNQVILKTIGGYIGETETPKEAVIRNLDNKIKLSIDSRRIVSYGRMLGYTVVEIPISIYTVELSSIELEQLAQASLSGITARVLSLKDAILLVQQDQVGDDATAMSLYKLYCDSL